MRANRAPNRPSARTRRKPWMSHAVTELTSLSLTEARDGLKKKSFSASELAAAHLTAIEKARALNAFVLETPDRAAEMAKACDARIAAGKAGPLEGIPLAVKDMFCTAGVRSTACSHILDNFVPTYESTVTSQLWRDGAVLLGKTNCDEFAMGSSNETSHFGPVVGSNQDGSNSFRNFSLRSGYRAAGFDLSAGYTLGTSNAEIPLVSGDQTVQKVTSDNNTFLFTASHQLPMHGSFSSSFTRSDINADYFGSSYHGIVDTVNASAGVNPKPRWNASLSMGYTDSLTGSLFQNLLPGGGQTGAGGCIFQSQQSEADDFLGILRGIGFEPVSQERLTFGIASIYVGIK